MSSARPDVIALEQKKRADALEKLGVVRQALENLDKN